MICDDDVNEWHVNTMFMDDESCKMYLKADEMEKIKLMNDHGQSLDKIVLNDFPVHFVSLLNRMAECWDEFFELVHEFQINRTKLRAAGINSSKASNHLLEGNDLPPSLPDIDVKLNDILTDMIDYFCTFNHHQRIFPFLAACFGCLGAITSRLKVNQKWAQSTVFAFIDEFVNQSCNWINDDGVELSDYLRTKWRGEFWFQTKLKMNIINKLNK